LQIRHLGRELGQGSTIKNITGTIIYAIKFISLARIVSLLSHAKSEG